MDAEGRQRIQKCYDSLLDLHCSQSDLLGPLIQKDVIDFNDQERILAERTSKDKAQQFICILLTKENSYKPFREVLKKAHEFIGKKLDSVEIDYDRIKQEQKDFGTFLEQFFQRYYSEIDNEKIFVRGKRIKEDLREELERHGKNDKGTAWPRVESKLLEVFKKLKKEKIKRSSPVDYRYKNLRRNVTESSDEDDSSDTRADVVCSLNEDIPSEKNQQQIKDLCAEELCSILKERFLKENLDIKLLTILVEEEVSGKVFLKVTTEEMKEIFPDLKFGKRKTMINIRDEMVEEEKQLLKVGKSLIPMEVLAARGEQSASHETQDEVLSEPLNPFRETFRKFDTPANGRASYRKHGALYTSSFAPSNLIHPVRKFLHDRSKSKKELPQWIGDESVLFIAACLNSRTNGTIYFGVEKLPDFGYIEGVIAHQNVVLRTFYRAIHDSFREEDFEIVCQCIRPPQFVEVTSPEKQRKLYVIEVDVIASHSIIKNRAFLLRKYKKDKGNICLLRYVGENILEANDSEIVQFMEKKAELSERREKLETLIMTDIPERKDLRQKFLNLFAAGNDRLTDEIYPLVFVSPLESDMDQIFISEHFEFVNDLDPKAIFDFDSCGEGNSLHRFIETDQEKVYRTVTADEFDRDNYVSDDYRNFLEDIGTSSHSPWIFCNGYEPLNKPPLKTLEWKQKLAVGYKESLRFYSEDLPKGRVVTIFLLFSKNYEIMIEAADEAFMKFQEQWIVMAENEGIANCWMDELIRRHLTDKKTLEERCIIGIPWHHVNSMIKEVMGCTQTNTKQIPTSTGVYCTLKERVKNELCDLEILGVNECNIEAIRAEEKSVEDHRRRVREEFFRGEQVNWWNFYFKDDHVLVRDKHKNLIDYTTKAANGKTIDEDNKVAVIHLHHQPGAGGTTTARQVLWSMKEKYRCCVVKQLTDQTVDQIARLRNYEDKEQPYPPIILIDNGDEDRLMHLYAHLENRARIVSRRSDIPFNVFCVLLLCTRRANLQMYTDQRTVQLKHELSDGELEWFKRKGDYLQQQFLADKGINPKLLISFNILKENFNPQYIKRTVTEFVDNIEKKEELSLLRYISLLNSYDLDFQPIPLSAFDSLMEQRTQRCIRFGSVSRDVGKGVHRRKHWDASLSQSLLVLLNRNAHTGGYFTGLAIINSLFAREILNYMASTKEITPSEMMLEFLESDIFKLDTRNRSLEQLKKIVRDILKKRDVDDQGVKKKFSPLILEIIDKEGNDQAQKVFETAFNISPEDAMFAQQVARLFIHSKNWDKAKHYASLATQKKPDNSFLWDTYGQVYLKKLTEMYLQCSADQKPLSYEDAEEAIKLAKDGIRVFQKEQEVSEKERNVRTNDAGYHAELHVIKLLLDLLRFWEPLEKKEVVHEFLVSADFIPEEMKRLSKDLIHDLKQLRFRAESLIRIVEEKESQLKTDFYNEIVEGNAKPFMSKYVQLRLGLDDYFGEDKDEIPSDLSFQEQAEYRRRRVKNIGGRSLIDIINMMRKNNIQDLCSIHSHAKENIESPFCNAFDLVTLISVSFFLHRLGVLKIRIQDLQQWSKRLFKVAASNAGQPEAAGRPYLESFLYPVLFHWPTENRKEYQENLCSVREIKDALKFLKVAFQKNHPRQREEGALFRKRDTTYFFLGNGTGLNEVVYYEDFIERYGAKFFKGDNIWEKAEIRNLLLRVKGILMKEGLEVSVHINTRLGNQESLFIPTAQPIGQRSLWQKEVFFFIGFSWSGPKAYDVSRDGPPPKTSNTPTTPPPLKLQMMMKNKPKREHVNGGVETHESFQRRILEVEDQMKKIKDSLEKSKQNSVQHKKLLAELESLAGEKKKLFQRKRMLLDVE